jgi:hypothetical protein
MNSPEQLPPHHVDHNNPSNHHSSHSLAADAYHGHGAPAKPGHTSPNKPLADSEGRLEDIIKHDPKHQHMGEVYKELDSLRQKDPTHFGKDLNEINKKLHKDGLLPGLTIIQDKYTGADGKEHAGYSTIATDQNNPGHRVGSEVSTNHPQVGDTPASRHHYHGMGHGLHHRYSSGRDSAEGGRAAGGGYDSHLRGASVPTGERKEMIDKALEIAHVPVNAATEAAMNKIITRESGWNPNIVNTWDSNARKGDPSKGLMQVIHSTFEAHRDKSLPDSQTDPLANMVAALNYMGSRYGHGDNGAGLMRVASRSGGY